MVCEERAGWLVWPSVCELANQHFPNAPTKPVNAPETGARPAFISRTRDGRHCDVGGYGRRAINSCGVGSAVREGLKV